MGALNVVTEGEECVAAQSNISVLCEPFFLFFAGEYRRLFCKDCLPFSFCKNILVLVANVDIDGVVTVCPFDSVDEFEAEDFR